MSRTFKTIISTISILLVLIILLGLCFEVFGTDKLKPSNWFDKSEENNSSDNSNNNDNKENVNVGGLIVEEIEHTSTLKLSSTVIEPEDFVLYGVAEASDSALTLTAIVEPETCTNKAVIWSVAWANPNSTWATGKTVTNYVTVESSSDDTGILTCLQAFGEQVVLTVTSDDNPEVTDSINLDYVKRVSTVKLSLGELTNCGPNIYQISCDKAYTVSYDVTYGVGTLQGTFQGGSVTTTLTNGLFNAVKNAITTSTVVFSQTSSTFVTANLKTVSSASITTGNPLTFLSLNGNPGNSKSQCQNAFYNYVHNNLNNQHATISMHYDYSYQGKGGCSGTASINVSFKLDSIVVSASSVSIENDDLIF